MVEVGAALPAGFPFEKGTTAVILWDQVTRCCIDTSAAVSVRNGTPIGHMVALSARGGVGARSGRS
jgi:hypothetical protein